jgi:hypothetical protein
LGVLDISRKGSSSLDPWGPCAERFDILQPFTKVGLLWLLFWLGDGRGGRGEWQEQPSCLPNLATFDLFPTSIPNHPKLFFNILQLFPNFQGQAYLSIPSPCCGRRGALVTSRAWDKPSKSFDCPSRGIGREARERTRPSEITALMS